MQAYFRNVPKCLLTRARIRAGAHPSARAHAASACPLKILKWLRINSLLLTHFLLEMIGYQRFTAQKYHNKTVLKVNFPA